MSLSILVGITLVSGVLGFVLPSKSAGNPVDFNRDIRPIFNANCMACHGGVKEAGGVSFSYRSQVLGKAKSGRPIVVPGSPRASELMARVTSNDPEMRMPLHGKPLEPAQIALLKQWIEQGAPWEDYWAFVAPKPQVLPTVQRHDWVRQPLDRFILARLEQEKLSPQPEADKSELLRRVSLDLTGLPPTPQEQAAFLADASQDAYEKQVDRLLASPRYGERWASLWLDLARYGDSKGYEKDYSRPGMWEYRDWVINAFNQNIPYDQFVIKQLAGDLLPDPSFEDRIATAFQRQTPANDEGGTDDEEFRLTAVMDRSATTWQVVNGTTMNCVQCHSHPYDPIKHTEYYKFMAFFNTSRDADIGSDRSLAEDHPILSVPLDKALYSEADQLQQNIERLRNAVVAPSRAAAADAKQWKLLPIKSGTVSETLAIERLIAENAAARANKSGADEEGDAWPRKSRAAAEGKAASPGKLQTVAERKTASPGKSPAADGNYPPRKGGGGGRSDLQTLLAKAKQAGSPRAGFKLHDGMAEKTGTVPSNSVFEFTASATLSVLTALRIEVPPADSNKARNSPETGFAVNRIDAWVVQPDGKAEKIDFKFIAPDSLDDVEGNMARMIRNTSATGDVMPRLAANSGFMADPNLFRTHTLVAVPNAPVTLPKGATLKLQMTQTETVNNQNSSAPRVRLSASSDARWTSFANDAGLAKNLADLERAERRIREIPSAPLPVMAEQVSYERRPTKEFDRGSFLTPVGPDLGADTPSLFPKLPAGAPHDRLTMAKWFFAPGQPLTARVAVNRAWEQLFGIGIVETLEDFGSAGEMPSHPHLLDWLALHFQNDLHWNQKALLREIVTSATYRQSARTTPALEARDPRNRLLARGPQQRLSAEMVRDQALLASGLLNPTMGGPPVMPEQPDGVWNTEAANPERWKNTTGADRYRRAIYTFIKRTAMYPSLVTFDAADRQLSSPRRIPTNTPLQALVTLNDPVFEEAAKAVAKRMAKEGPKDLDGRLNFGARLMLSRDLNPGELIVLRKLSDTNGQVAVASALFNLDAALTR